ncbi:MAG: sodium:solute symporter family protein [Bacilli bacterium]|nr:sodium:solute symporter family protein [Bacilli bacterium]
MIIAIIVTFFVFLVISFIVSRKAKSSDDYFVASRKAPTFLIAGSLIASFLSTGAYTGDLGEAFSGGFGPIFLIDCILVLGYILGSLFFGRYLRRSKCKTITEFFASRFKSKAIKIVADIITIICVFVYLLSCAQGVVTVLVATTGLSRTLCSIICVAFFALITIIGGASGVLVTDTIMFAFFTLITIISVIFIANINGGWFTSLKLFKEQGSIDFLSIFGSNDYLYANKGLNLTWTIISGFSWMGVVFCGPWQASRYTMAKNEHVAVRSSAIAIPFVIIICFLTLMSGVFIKQIGGTSGLEPSSVIIWTALNKLPAVLGTLLVVGILLAGMSSATTFFQLLGSTFSLDVVHSKKHSKLISILFISFCAILISLLCIFNPPSIFWLMQFGSVIIACSFLPQAISSVWSKNVSKQGFLGGMIAGFLVSFSIKLYSSITGKLMPIYADPFLWGVLSNVLVMIILSIVFERDEQSVLNREKLFIVPKEEKNPKDVKTTKKFIFVSIGISAVLVVFLICFWALPTII